MIHAIRKKKILPILFILSDISCFYIHITDYLKEVTKGEIFVPPGLRLTCEIASALFHWGVGKCFS